MRNIAAGMWAMLGGDEETLDALELVGDGRVLPSVFDVTGLATAAVGVASLAAAELAGIRNQCEVEPVRVTTWEASAAFRCENLFVAVEGWELPPVWDPLAGDYQGADGWIRLHTNYAHHRAAALRALRLEDPSRETVAATVADWPIAELETRVVEEGGASAAMYSHEAWIGHPQGRATAAEPPIGVVSRPGGSTRSLPPSERPLGAVKVLDLTRVIAGPFATRFLAAWGAEVLRIDPPGFDEVPAIVPETTAGKRCAFLDLSSTDGRARLLELVRESDVLVHGLRPGALDALGLDHDTLIEANPVLIVSQHNAYGWSGPWSGRRGFDSLVQMSCGIAAAQGADRPRPLPAQALDHATGMLIAAAVSRALTVRARTGVPSDIRGSLIGTANFLYELPDPDGTSTSPPSFTERDTEPRRTHWGPARSVPIPGRIGDRKPCLALEPGPLGRDTPAYAETALPA